MRFANVIRWKKLFVYDIVAVITAERNECNSCKYQENKQDISETSEFR